MVHTVGLWNANRCQVSFTICLFSREVNREKLDSQPHLIICNVGIEVLNRIVKVQRQSVAKNPVHRCQRICPNPGYFSIFASSSLNKIRPPWGTTTTVLLLLKILYVGQLNLHSRPEVAVIYFFFAISKCQMSPSSFLPNGIKKGSFFHFLILTQLGFLFPFLLCIKCLLIFCFSVWWMMLCKCQKRSLLKPEWELMICFFFGKTNGFSLPFIPKWVWFTLCHLYQFLSN